ncbi:MAG: hypothetical protein ACR2OZ_01965 [Verrucomicrobiales bacterium]
MDMLLRPMMWRASELACACGFVFPGACESGHGGAALAKQAGANRLPAQAALLAMTLQLLAGQPLASAEKPAPYVRPAPDPSDPHVTASSNGQFIIHGGDHEERARLAMQIEEMHEDFATLCDRTERDPDPAVSLPEPAGQRQPIHVWLGQGAGSIPQPQITHLDGANRTIFGISIGAAEAGRSEVFHRETLRLLLAERILRSHAGAKIDDGSALVPAWLFIGLSAALDHRKCGQPSARFASIFKAGRLMSIDEVLSKRPEELDSLSREVYRASACALVLMLLEQPQGPIRFRRFLAQIPLAREGFHSQLVRHFPGLALSKNSLEKWCSIQFATLADPNVFELFTASETEQRLAEALVVRYTEPVEKKSFTSRLTGLFSGGNKTSRALVPTEPGAGVAPSATTTSVPPPGQEKAVPLAEIDAILRIEKRDGVLKRNQSALATLNLQAFPLHRPIINAYQKVLGLLIKGKTKGLAQKLSALAAHRAGIIRRMGDVEDYLDWYEATQRATPSSTFDDYFKLLDKLEAHPKRNDPISRYLDDIEQEYK